MQNIPLIENIPAFHKQTNQKQARIVELISMRYAGRLKMISCIKKVTYLKLVTTCWCLLMTLLSLELIMIILNTHLHETNRTLPAVRRHVYVISVNYAYSASLALRAFSIQVALYIPFG